jgi:hypothetical protein
VARPGWKAGSRWPSSTAGAAWDEAQISSFLCLWIVYGLWFLAGLFVPEWRGLP